MLLIIYVQQLIQSRLDCEVVSYGSVPLKTYLPDGDIDLTVLKGPNAGESVAHDVLTLLQDEEKNENAEYQVKDTQFIDAEVISIVYGVAECIQVWVSQVRPSPFTAKR